jgi:hypothetical protein
LFGSFPSSPFLILSESSLFLPSDVYEAIKAKDFASLENFLDSTWIDFNAPLKENTYTICLSLDLHFFRFEIHIPFDFSFSSFYSLLHWCSFVAAVSVGWLA